MALAYAQRGAGLVLTYVGHCGSPPPPVLSPETVARSVLRVVDKHKSGATVGPLNPLMRLGFAAVPSLFDALVGPLFQLFALSKEPQAATEGNVFLPSPDVEPADG